jgi:hypothetical protein
MVSSSLAERYLAGAVAHGWLSNLDCRDGRSGKQLAWSGEVFFAKSMSSSLISNGLKASNLRSVRMSAVACFLL